MSSRSENFRRVLGRVIQQDFVGRAAELNRIIAQAESAKAGRGLLLLMEPSAGVSELLRQAYDQIFNRRSDVIPIYFAFTRNETTAVSAAIEFLNTFLQQYIAYRRDEPVVSDAPLTLHDLVELAPGPDLEWIEQLVESYNRIRFSNDDKALVRFCLGAPQRVPAVSSKEKLILTDFNWDKQKTAKTKFTIKIAPKMFSRAWIDQATCGLTNSGKLHYSIEGGEAPFTITVKKEGSNEILKQWNQSAKSNTELQLSSGNYEYIVKDAKGNLYTETLFVADKEGTFPNLKPDYKLINGNPLVLDASAGLPEENYEYQWYYEGDFIDNNPKITITQAGNYELRLFSEQNCKTTSKIEVSTDGKEIVDSSNVILYPNPTTNGYFTVSMQFPKKTNATITINSLTGALLKQKKITQIQTYIYADYLTTSGIYLVTVNSDFGTKTFKVIKK